VIIDNLLLKILFISTSDNFAGGAPRSLVELLCNLDRTKISPYFCSPYRGIIFEKVIEMGIPVLKLPEPTDRTPPFFALNSISPLIRFIRNNKIDIIHNNQVNDALFSMIPAKITHTPLIIHHRDPTFLKSHRLLTSMADANIAISTWQNDKNLLGKGVVIHNGINLDDFLIVKPGLEMEIIAEEQEIRVGLLGRIMIHKAQDIFVQSAYLVLKSTKKVKFFIAGDDQDATSAAYIARVKKLVIKLGLEEKVIFTGHIDTPADFYQSMDLIVVPSRKESFGRVIIEAMACEKPVIATNVWGALDIVTPETGILVEPENPNALAEAILGLIQDPIKRQLMGKNGRKHVENNFTIEHTLKKIYALYERVLQ